MSPYVSWILLFVGILARIFVPFLIARREDPSLGWSWRYVWPQVLAFAIIALMLPVIVADLASIGELQYQAAFLVGWAAGDIGNLGRKVLGG